MDLIPQSGPHLHILLNHFPSVGLVVALGFYITAFITHSDVMKRSCLVLFVILGILGIPTYVSGAASMWVLSTVPEIPQGMINVHRDMALLAFIGLGITGSGAWLVLWQARHVGRLSNRALYVVLAFAIITLGLMTETGHLGGQINHPEIQSAAEILAADQNVGRTISIEGIMGGDWMFVSMETLHFIGMAFIFGTVLIVTLRVLGLAKSVPFSAVHRLLPLGFLGLLINSVSGMLLFIGDSGRYVAMDLFPAKIALLVIGAFAVLYFSLFERIWNVKAGEDAPITAKAVAAVTLLAWTGVIVLGRFLPYMEG